MDKRVIVEKLEGALRAELLVAGRLARDTAEAANHPEARPDGDKDTRKLELSYLAAGQAARVQELETALALLGTLPLRSFGAGEPLQAGALVELDVAGKAQRVFLSPAGGGLKVSDDRGEISIVTPPSPLGRGLLGKTVGDSFELVIGGQSREVEILTAE